MRVWVPIIVLMFSAVAPLAVGQPRPPQPPPGALMYSCTTGDGPDRMMMMRLREASGSEPQLQANLQAARHAIEDAATLRRRFLAGEALEAPYDGASQFMALSRSADTPRKAELFRRVAEDQWSRSHFSAARQRVAWAQGLNEAATAYAFAFVARDGCGVDESNTAWLKADLAKNGWFTIAEFGKMGDTAAFLLVQHADRDRPFQAEVLKLVEPLVATGQTRPSTYAYLYDRVAVGEQRPQRYGTQGRCVGPGAWEPLAVEAPEGLDARRAAVGLPPVADYKQAFVKNCRGADPPAPTPSAGSPASSPSGLPVRPSP